MGAKDSARNTLRGILSSEGLTGLYRGMSLPLMGTVLETAMLFTANGYLKRRLREEQGLHPDAELPMPYVLLAGAGTGFCVAWVLTPIELVKCRMQVSGQPMEVGGMSSSSSSSVSGGGSGGTTLGVDGGKGGGAKELLRHPVYKGPLDCILKAVREEGVKVMYRGHMGTLLREIRGTAGWFGAYETFLRGITPPGVKRSELNPGFVVAAGALGGMVYWAAMYPADTVKSAMQTGGKDSQGSFMTTLASVYRAGGLRALYAGITPTIIRAAPSNAVIFLVYEECSKILNKTMALEGELV